MKRVDFLVKLKKQGKLKVVDSSEEVAKSYIEKSESNFISAKILFENDRLEESISLLYYSMYHLLMALFKTGIKSKNHSASIILLKKVFDFDNSKIFFAKKERIDKQYYADFFVVKKDVEDLFSEAENFNKKLFDFVSRLNNVQIKLYRKKFKELINEV